ncbi:MAG: GGDEF domain-containing protein [Clostridiales bacterium]|nr:GGDEF domain-containing protein [Clostridiales bacterium]
MIKQLFYKDSYEYGKFKESILKDNMKRIRMFSLVIMILEAGFLMGTFLVPHMFAQDQLIHYRSHYIFLLVGTIIMLFLCFKYNKRKKYHVIYEIMVYLSTTICLLWGSSITIIDVSINNTTTVYLTFVFILSAALIIRPDIYLLMLLIVQSLFVVCLPESSQVAAVQVNTSIFLLFAWFVSRYQYFTHFEKYRNELIINDKGDILERQNAELVRLMMTDHLTGIYNRYSLDDILSKKWIEAYVHKSYLTVMMLDIDLFKKFNDTYGHIKGDECLMKVSRVLTDISVQYDGYAFRYGGDEFCLIFSDLRYKDVVLEELNRQIKAIEVQVADMRVSIELSIGVFHEVPKESKNEWQCMDLADKDLYVKKSLRRRRFTDELI